MACILCVSNLGVNAATPNNFTITNTSQISYSIQTQSGNSPTNSDVVSSSTVSIKTVSNTPITMGLGTVTANGSATEVLSGGSCYANGNLQNLPNPSFVSGNSVSIPTPVNFTSENILKSGDPLFIKVFDLNQVTNPTAIEKLNVTVTNDLGDKEVVVLTETAPSSGIFLGYIQTVRTNVVQSDCQLSVKSNDKITVTYSNNGNTSTISATILVDPLGKIFDSNSGEFINNARVTLINADTGLPAKVYGDDGVSDYPNTVLSGNTVIDSGGHSYSYSTGEFRFPLVHPGNYKISVVPPTGYSFPSQIEDATLRSKFPTYTILTGGSKGLTFPVISSIVYLDIPVDKRSGNLVINKTVSNNIAALGDFVQYTVTIQNTDKNSISNVNLNDILPKGFKVKPESVYVDNVRVIPVYDGKTLQYNLGTLLTNQTRTIKYVTQISMNSDLGDAVNYATATGTGATSNTAKSTVLVKDDLMSDKAIIVGNVYETQDCNRDNLKPMEGIKIQFETGDFVYSDKQGRWHIDNLKPMTHVAQIDKLSLPTDYYPVLCEANNRFAQNPNSQFVESRPSSIERVDFYVKKKTLVEKRANAKELSIADLLGGGDAKLETKNSKTGEKSFKENNKAGTEALSLNDKFMLSANPVDKILFPEEKYNPSVPAVGFALQTKGNQKVKLLINDKSVNDFNFDGSRYSADKSVVIYYWRGIPLRDGKNTIIADIVDENGKVTNTMTKELFFTTNIVEAHFVPSQSKLKANGKDPIEVAVRFIDEFGHPAHKGLSGTYELNGNYTPYFDRGDGLPLDMLNTRNENKNQYVVGEDGLAMIKLMPTNQSGEMTLRFNLKDQQAIVRPWITADKREWILVGIAEGTKAFNNVMNHTDSKNHQKGMEIVEDNQGRIAFYGKGTVKGDYLLTMSYDNRKDTTLNQGTTSAVTQELYSVYGDSTIAQKDAESAKRIFIRIEKEKFYAMFGNYQTNLSVTDLTRFDRNLTGLKSEYKGDNFNYNVFAAKTATLQQKQEIKTDGTSGPYRTATPIVIGSETVTLVLRNQNQRDQIISSKSLSRGVDYNVDYDLGIITLKESTPIYDIYFNPYYIHVEYNTLDTKGDHTVVGGRVAYNINEKTEIGITTVVDQGNQVKQQMSGVDLQYKDTNLVLKMETAISSNKDLDVTKDGQAYNVEAQYQKEWGHVKVYTKKVDPDFGLTAALPADTGIQKTGAEGLLKLKNDMSLKGELLTQKDLKVNSSQTTGEVKLEKRFNESFTGYVGDRISSITNGTISNTNISNSPTATGTTTGDQSNNSILLGGEYRFTDIPLKLNTQINYTQNPNLVSPKKVLLGAEYTFNNELIGVADKQFNDYGSGITSNVNRVGLKYKPWTGGQIQSYVGNDTGMTPNKFYQFGIDQNFKYNLWSFDVGFAKQTWDKKIDSTLIPAGTLITQDNFNSYVLGATYRNEPLVYQVKAEAKSGSLENKVHLTNNLYRKIDDEWSFSLGQDYLKVNSTTTNGMDTITQDIRGGLSYRGKDNIVLGRIDWINQQQNAQKSAKYVINLHDNYKPSYDWEMFSHVGYKYVVTTFDTQEYKGSSYLVSGGVRKYLNKDWDIGIQGLYAASPSVNTVSKGFGASIGYNVFKNAWVSVGYQKLNSYDKNYSFDDSYLNGFFIKFRIKFDEETFHLNKTDNKGALN